MKVATSEAETEGPSRVRELGARAQEWQDNAQRLADEARDWVVAHPFAALGIAVAAGFIVGRVVRR